MIENITLCEYYLNQGYVLVPWHYFSVVAAFGFVVGSITTFIIVQIRKMMRR